MENSNNAYKSRMLVAEIMVEPTVARFLMTMKTELPQSFEHSIDVAYLAGEVAYELGLEYVDDVVRGALLHDIGKLCLPKDLLLSTRELSPYEKNVLREHSTRGYELVFSDPDLSEIVKDVVLYHHEKQDGSGYPSGKSAKDLKKATKIVTVCDIYDAMTKTRPYHKPYGAYEALNIMVNEPIDKSILKVLKECPDR